MKLDVLKLRDAAKILINLSIFFSTFLVLRLSLAYVPTYYFFGCEMFLYCARRTFFLSLTLFIIINGDDR